MERKGYVYLVRCGCFPYYKIGATTMGNVVERVKALQTATPFDLEMIAYARTSNVEEAEAKLHTQYHFQRLRGEWFYFTPKRLELVLEDFLVLDEIGWALDDVGRALEHLIDHDAAQGRPCVY